jgi:cytochrome P450 family 138
MSAAAAAPGHVIDGLPPGPGGPGALQGVGMLLRQRPYLERLRRRHGPLFCVRAFGFGRMVVVADPALVKQVFTADPAVLHAGDRSPLRRILGANSLLGIDEDRHLEQRRLLLPPFRGERMRAYEAIIEELTLAEIEGWDEDAELPVAPAMRRITVRAILRAVFGATGRDLAELERLLPAWTTLGSLLSTLTVLHRDLGPWSPWGRFLRLRARIDAVLDRLIATARADAALGERADVLALLVQARHVDGAPMRDAEIRDQLVTLLAAGHETTAHQLSWAVERLRRHPDVLGRLAEEADAGGRALRDATIREVQRTRPVVMFAARWPTEPYELGGYRLPVSVTIASMAALTHYDPRLFPDPDRFDPDRFLRRAAADSYAWIPFGGGRRRCIGAAFAHMELDVVLRTLLRRAELVPTSEPGEAWAFRGVASGPDRGGLVRIRRRA